MAPKSQAYYAENRAGNEALSDSVGGRQQANWAGESIKEQSERTRKMQTKEWADDARKGAADKTKTIDSQNPSKKKSSKKTKNKKRISTKK